MKENNNELWGTDPSKFGTSDPIQYQKIIDPDDLPTYLNHFYAFRYNIIKGYTEISVNGDWHQLDDRRFNSIYQQIKQDGGKTTEANLRSLLNSDFVPEYDPFLAYFECLPSIDQTRDYIRELADQVITTDRGYWELCLKKWLVATVACALEQRVVNHTVLILKGTQGCGKSTYLGNLIPKLLQDYYYGGALDPKNKDTIIHLAECLIINLDELEALTKYKEAALKEIITKTDIRVRRPYDKFSQNLMRRASFVGSVNIDQVLSDSTGSRRFLIHEVTSINYQHSVDIDKVWKQAYDLYLSGFKYYFDQNEIKLINERNQDFEIIKPEEELLLNKYRPYRNAKGGPIKKTATEILKEIYGDKLPGNVRGEAIKLGLALTKHGFESVKMKSTKYYLLQRPKSYPTSDPLENFYSGDTHEA